MLLDAVVESWAPPILSVLVGGILASIIAPRIQRRFEENKNQTSRRLAIAEEIASTFPLYILNWTRLKQISNLEIKKGLLNEDEKPRKLQFIEQRNSARARLMELCGVSQIYFSTKTCDLMSDFIKWDGAQAVRDWTTSLLSPNGLCGNTALSIL